jgi:hypothetical protein
MPTKEEVAKVLAEGHRKADADTKDIYFFDDPSTDEIRLLEVSATVPATGEVLPFKFKADPADGITYPSSVILVNLEEWEAIKKGAVVLPDGWVLDQAEAL